MLERARERVRRRREHARPRRVVRARLFEPAVQRRDRRALARLESLMGHPTAADDAVTAAKLAANSVVSASIANGTIVTADLADNSITSAKIVGFPHYDPQKTRVRA